MALPWALAVLSLLPLLDAQDPACAILKPAPITNATLERLSGKWFYIASVFRNPEYNQSARQIQATFFYFTPNITEDVILLREYQTTGQCVYNSSYLQVQRENGTLSRYADKQDVTEEQLREFHEALKCMGLRETEVLYTDGKKDLCGPLEKQHEEERKKENKGSQVNTELG
ncbi:alpha-1-acid glycoprotein 2-like isoform 4-T4 [Dugong dugon]